MDGKLSRKHSLLDLFHLTVSAESRACCEGTNTLLNEKLSDNWISGSLVDILTQRMNHKDFGSLLTFPPTHALIYLCWHMCSVNYVWVHDVLKLLSGRWKEAAGTEHVYRRRNIFGASVELAVSRTAVQGNWIFLNWGIKVSRENMCVCVLYWLWKCIFLWDNKSQLTVFFKQSIKIWSE